MLRIRTTHRNSSGFTLIELLVVMVIILGVTASAIVVVTPRLAGRRIRESARAVSIFLENAKTRAARIGRPAAVWLERAPGLPGGCFTLYQAEDPPPYTGDFVASTIAVDGSTGYVVGFPAGDTGWIGLLRPGDLLKLNFQGHLYRLSGPVDTNGYLVGPPSSWTISYFGTYAAFLPTTPPGGVPFQIFRQPTRIGDPLELSASTIVDLQASGFDSELQFAPFLPRFSPNAAIAGGDNSAVIISFNPSGTLDRVYCWDYSSVTPIWDGYTPVEPVYLLIGGRNAVPWDPAGPASQPMPNWQRLENVWISIHPRTGLVLASEAYAVDPTSALPFQMLVSRSHARNGDRVGGR